MNLKANKRKFLARVMLLVLLVASLFSFVGCGIEPHVKKGQYYVDNRSLQSLNWELKAVSDIEEFALDDITFSLYVGQQDEVNESVYTNKYGTLDNVYFVIYAANTVDREKMSTDELYAGDYVDNVLNYAYVVKEIPIEEVLNNFEYRCVDIPFIGYYFNHYDKITIPKECILGGLEDTYKSIFIGCCLAQKYYEENEVRYVSGFISREIVLSYQMKDDGTVFINFPNSK